MPFDDTLGDLAQQQPPPPRGLPPPQPTPYGIARAQEHQQQWAMPPISDQLGDIATKTLQTPGNVLYGANQWVGDRMQTAMQGFGQVDNAESVQAGTDLALSAFGGGMFGGIERGGLGALRMARAPSEAFFSNFGGKDSFKLISKETGKDMGYMHTTYDPASKDLYINYMGSAVKTSKGFGAKPYSGESHWGMGTHELQTLGPDILKEYPDVQTVSFLRLPGIRDDYNLTPRAGRLSRAMKFKVNRTPDGDMTLELIESRAIPRPTGMPPEPPPRAPSPPMTQNPTTGRWEGMGPEWEPPPRTVSRPPTAGQQFNQNPQMSDANFQWLIDRILRGEN